MFASQYTKVSPETHKNPCRIDAGVPATMTPELSNEEILILQTMWRAKALGAHGITADLLASRISDMPKTGVSEGLGGLKTRGLVTTTNRNGADHFGLSPLGAAFVRQLQDRQLGDLTQGL